MLMTAAGTVAPAKVLVLGAGVAGLQAIATARRLGAVVTGFDVRPAVREQIESLGAQWLDLGVGGAEAEGGYARELTEEERRQQQEALEARIGGFDAVITTAAVPGRPAPKLIPASAVAAMRPGSVIVDLAAETGGNCELTEPGEVVEREGVTIVGLREPSELDGDACQPAALPEPGRPAHAPGPRRRARAGLGRRDHVRRLRDPKGGGRMSRRLPVFATSAPAQLGRNWHRFGTVPAQTRRPAGGIVDREGGGLSPTLGWGAALGSSGEGVAG